MHHRQTRPSNRNRVKQKENVKTAVAHIKSNILTTRGNQRISFYKKCRSENGLEGTLEEIGAVGRGVKVLLKLVARMEDVEIWSIIVLAVSNTGLFNHLPISGNLFIRQCCHPEASLGDSLDGQEPVQLACLK
jgi:hypothetical protein